MKEYEMVEDMAENGSVWHMKTQAGPLLQVRKTDSTSDNKYNTGENRRGPEFVWKRRYKRDI